MVRIASLSPAATEILFALGKGREIVCVDQFSDFPEGAKALPHLKGPTEVDTEELRRFAPELVLTETVVQGELAHTLRGAGFSVVHQDPRTLSEVSESIRAYGALLDVDVSAKELQLRMQRGFNDVKKKAKHLERRPHVYIEEWHLPPMASGNWVPEIVALAGGVPFPLKPGELSREVMLEEVSSFDPDLIVLSLCGAGMSPSKAIVTERPGWEMLRAPIRVIDDSLLNRPGPRLVEGAQRLYGWLFELTH